MSQVKIVELTDQNTCKICNDALAKYSCPRCNVTYCSLACYRSQQHLQCSEEFYKSCVFEELSSSKATPGPGGDAYQEMVKILERNRFRQEGGEGVEAGEEDVNSDLDSDDDEDVSDIAERMAGVNLDNADEVWEKLTEDEQQEFMAFLKSEDVTKLVPSWTPWWLHTTKKVEEIEKCDSYKSQCPALVQIKDFEKISTKPPADCVKFNLVNVLAAYAFTMRYFNGESVDFAREAVTCIISISLTLKVNQNFEDLETAAASVEHECTKSDWIVADKENYAILREDLGKILAGPSTSEPKLYILSALSDLHRLLNSALAAQCNKSDFSSKFPNDQFPDVKLESKTKIKTVIRKIEYLLSYAKDCVVFC